MAAGEWRRVLGHHPCSRLAAVLRSIKAAPLREGRHGGAASGSAGYVAGAPGTSHAAGAGSPHFAVGERVQGRWLATGALRDYPHARFGTLWCSVASRRRRLGRDDKPHTGVGQGAGRMAGVGQGVGRMAAAPATRAAPECLPSLSGVMNNFGTCTAKQHMQLSDTCCCDHTLNSFRRT